MVFQVGAFFEEESAGIHDVKSFISGVVDQYDSVVFFPFSSLAEKWAGELLAQVQQSDSHHRQNSHITTSLTTLAQVGTPDEVSDDAAQLHAPPPVLLVCLDEPYPPELVGNSPDLPESSLILHVIRRQAGPDDDVDQMLGQLNQLLIGGVLMDNPFYIPPALPAHSGLLGWRLEQLEILHHMRGQAVSAEIAARSLVASELAASPEDRRHAEAPQAFEMHVLSQINDIVVAIDMDYRVIFWNSAAEQTYGLLASEALGQQLEDCYTSRHQDPSESERALALINANQVWRGNVFHRKRDGVEIPVRASVGLLTAADGTPYGMLSIMYDRTAEKALQDALVESAHTLELLSNHTHDLIALHDPDGRYRYVSPSFEQHLGYEPDELIGSNPYELVHPDDIKRIEMESHRRALDGASGHKIDSRIRHRDGSYTWFETVTEPIFNGQGKVTGLVTSSRGIQQRHVAEQKLLGRNEELRHMTARLVEVEESERKRIAQELHDNLGRNLSLASIRLNMLKKQVGGEVFRQNQEDFRALERLLQELTMFVRSAIDDLYPAELDEWGLEPTVTTFAARLTQNLSLQVKFHNMLEARRLPSNIERSLYRIIQEALVNIVKHAEASHVLIRLVGTASDYTLTIRDDGKGFDISQPGANGMGIAIMQERATTIGAECTIASRMGQGTLVSVSSLI